MPHSRDELHLGRQQRILFRKGEARLEEPTLAEIWSRTDMERNGQGSY